MSRIYPWQEAHWQHFIERAQSGQLPHALLFVGPHGLGKNQFASQFIQTLLCERAPTLSGACGECRSCRFYNAGTHADYVQLTPLEAGKDIKIDQVREMIAFLQLKPSVSRYKIALISPADDLNTSAANSMLKTLEEPTAYTLLIMITSKPSSLPATILSRCQQLQFTPPPAALAQAWLAPQLTAGQDAEFLLRLTGGAPLAALALAQGEGLALRQRLFDDLNQIAQRKLDPLKITEPWSKQMPDMIGWVYQWLSDMIRLKNAATPALLISTDMTTPLTALAQKVGSVQLYELLDKTHSLMRLMEGQANKEMLMEDFLLTWSASFSQSHSAH